MIVVLPLSLWCRRELTNGGVTSPTSDEGPITADRDSSSRTVQFKNRRYPFFSECALNKNSS